jgi:hypothetical protein
MESLLPGQNISIARLCLFGAEVYRQTDSVLAEKLYRRALRSAIGSYGVDSPTVGLILVSFEEFLENEGRNDEAQALWSDIRTVCIRIFELSNGLKA